MHYIFNASAISDDYVNKTSAGRYYELKYTFPDVLIIFKRNNAFYGFEETAIILSNLYKIPRYTKKGMEVVKINEKFFTQITNSNEKLHGLAYIIDDNCALSFVWGDTYCIPEPSVFRTNNLERAHSSNKKTTYNSNKKQKEPYTKNGGGWHDDVWAPGLPSSRFFRTKSRKKWK